MDTLLVFFAFPLAVIIISLILEKILKNPIAVSALIFAIFLIVTFAVFDATFLIATLAYTILAFITASIAHLFKCRHRQESNICDLLSDFLENNNSDNDEDNDDNDSENDNGCGCGCTTGRNRFRR